MPDTTCHMSISLDGFVAGPDQSRNGRKGEQKAKPSWNLQTIHMPLLISGRVCKLSGARPLAAQAGLVWEGSGRA